MDPKKAIRLKTNVELYTPKILNVGTPLFCFGAVKSMVGSVALCPLMNDWFRFNSKSA